DKTRTLTGQVADQAARSSGDRGAARHRQDPCPARAGTHAAEPCPANRTRAARRRHAHKRQCPQDRRNLVTSQLSAALRAAAAGIHPDEAGTGLIIGHGTFLHRPDFTRHVETAASISDGTLMAWIDWDAVVTALDTGLFPASGGEQRILRLAASLAAGHPVSLRDASPGQI